MKYLFALVTVTALFLSMAHSGPTPQKKGINLDIEISDVTFNIQETMDLTEFDLQLLKEYADFLRREDPYGFARAGGEDELMSRAREGRIDISIVEQILSPEPFYDEFFDMLGDEFFDEKEDEEDKLGVNTRTLYPDLYKCTPRWNFDGRQADRNIKKRVHFNIYRQVPMLWNNKLAA